MCVRVVTTHTAHRVQSNYVKHVADWPQHSLVGNVCLCSQSVGSEHPSRSLLVNICVRGDSRSPLSSPLLAIISSDPLRSWLSLPSGAHTRCSCRRAQRIPVSPVRHSHQDGSTLLAVQTSSSHLRVKEELKHTETRFPFTSPALTWPSETYMMGLQSRLMLLLCFIPTAACNMFAFTEEPSERAGKGDGYCSRILRAQGNRKEGNSEFRLRVEGDPESYQPGSTYRGWC